MELADEPGPHRARVDRRASVISSRTHVQMARELGMDPGSWASSTTTSRTSQRRIRSGIRPSWPDSRGCSARNGSNCAENRAMNRAIVARFRQLVCQMEFGDPATNPATVAGTRPPPPLAERAKTMRDKRPMGPHSCVDGPNLIELADQFRVSSRACTRMAGANEVVLARKPRRERFAARARRGVAQSGSRTVLFSGTCRSRTCLSSSEFTA